MPYTDLTQQEIDDVYAAGGVFVSKKEIIEATGLPRSTVHNHIVTGKVNALRYRNRTYFTPEAAENYIKMVKLGLLSGNTK